MMKDLQQGSEDMLEKLQNNRQRQNEIKQDELTRRTNKLIR
jgi:hypothetical protein